MKPRFRLRRCVSSAEATARDAAIRADFDGTNAAQLARAYGVSTRRVYRAVRQPFTGEVRS